MTANKNARLYELLAMRTAIRELINELATTEENYRVMRPLLDELIEVATAEKELNDAIRAEIMEDIKRREREALCER